MEDRLPLMPYQAFIDGLRAIAVVAVVAYHAGIPGISGGFVGVDIFFVISGYLIISQISAGLKRGSFSFKTFWARRALRILPSYFLVIICTVAIAQFILVLPGEFRDLGSQVTYSALMLANHYFLDQQGYFETSAELKPLLHLWSLAVEEQFYIFAPIAMVLLAAAHRRFGSSIPFIVVTIAAVASFCLCVWLTTAVEDKNYSFFLMPLRAWEFMAGGMVATFVPVARRLTWLPKSFLFFLGLGLIAYSIFFFQSSLHYPSYYAFIPVAGTVLVISGGTVNPNAAIVRLMGSKPFVAVGLVSYSWYLWHWPLMSLARIYNFEVLPLSWGVSIAFGSFLLATLTYLFVEKPIRAWRIRTKVDFSWKPLAVSIVAIAGVASIGIFTSQFLASAARSDMPRWAIPDSRYPNNACTLNTIDIAQDCLDFAAGSPLGLLIGDSHARAIWRTVQQQTRDSGYQLATLMGSGCVGLFGVNRYDSEQVPSRQNCTDEFLNGKSVISDLQPEFAIIASRWLVYADGVSGSKRVSLGPISSDSPGPNQRDIFISSLRETIEFLKSSGVERIVVLGPAPEIFPAPPECVLRSDHYGYDRQLHCSEQASEVTAWRQEAVSRLHAATQDISNVVVLDPYDIFCDEELCRPYDGEGPVLYRDTNHYNDFGARAILSNFDSEFDWLLGNETSVSSN